MSDVTRRQFCGLGLVAPVAGFGGRRPKNRRAGHKDTRLYHGPIRVPVDVCEMASRGRVVQTTARHMAVRVSLAGPLKKHDLRRCDFVVQGSHRLAIRVSLGPFVGPCGRNRSRNRRNQNATPKKRKKPVFSGKNLSCGGVTGSVD